MASQILIPFDGKERDAQELLQKEIYDFLVIVGRYCSKKDIVDGLAKLGIKNTRGKRCTSADITPFLERLQETEEIRSIYVSGHYRFGVDNEKAAVQKRASELFTSGAVVRWGNTEYIKGGMQWDFPLSYEEDKLLATLRYCWAAGPNTLIEYMDSRENESWRTPAPIPLKIYATLFPAPYLSDYYEAINTKLKEEFCQNIASAPYPIGQLRFAIEWLLEMQSQGQKQELPIIEPYLFHFICTQNRNGLHHLYGDYPLLNTHFDAFVALLECRGNDALTLLSHYIAEIRIIKKKKAFLPGGITGLTYLLLLLADEQYDLYKQEFGRFTRQYKKDYYQTIAAFALDSYEKNGAYNNFSMIMSDLSQDTANSPWMAILELLAFCAGKAATEQYEYKRITQYAAIAKKENYSLLCNFLTKPTKAGTVPLRGTLFKAVDSWELLLKKLEELTEDKKEKSTKAPSQKRLSWRMGWSPDLDDVRIEPFEQVLQKKGWSKGKSVALKRLKNKTGDLSFLTPQDIQVCSAIYKESSGWAYDTWYDIEPSKAVPALINHPNLFHIVTGHPLTLEAKEPELKIEKKGKKVSLSITPKPRDLRAHYRLTTSSDDTKLFYTKYSSKIRELHKLLEAENSIPMEALAQVETLVGKLSNLITVAGNVTAADALIEEADKEIKIRCTPQDEGLAIQCIVIPSPETGAHAPGAGSELLQIKRGSDLIQIKRDLKAEIKSAKRVVSHCETLIPNKQFSWFLSDPTEQLRFLSELKTVPNSPQILWPKGENIEVSAPASASSLKIAVGGSIDWLDLSGSITTDNGDSIDLSELLIKTKENPNSTFIPLSDRKFLAITEKLRKQFDLLAGVSRVSKKKLSLHPLALLSSSELLESSGVSDRKKLWATIRERWQNGEKYAPSIPHNLEATLRPYQEEGFFWAARLAVGGFGACLADDMGLGKTVQSIALLLERSSGSALVVAPTSLITVWYRELLRFAPSLKTVVVSASDSIIPMAKPGVVTITSYGVLVSREEQFTDCSWHTLILDEAQAIKNSATKRTKAVKALDAEFRLACTGTPIENHLGELWSLFDFLIPGLLGTREQFSQKFSDDASLQQLKSVVKPFILRRRKSDVLSELPAKTEIILPVTFSSEERKRYEAIRLAALDEINAQEGTPNRFSILAQLTKLRQSCCHPALLDETYRGASAKLELLSKEIQTLRENGHRALIFSQFVSHLQIVKEWCEKENISYHYLDGSSTQKSRAKSVEAFQNGKSELFLISLKAGGTGLTLTAADYVFILDPWWNPAVEDQAADRTHRIGQTRPVTVYRLVVENSVEEKIMKLHAGKRELTDALLSNTSSATSLSEEELRALFLEGE